MTDRCVVGVDYGTISGRAVVVRVSDGAELGTAVHENSHGLIDLLFARYQNVYGQASDDRRPPVQKELA